jgi:anti-sigma regulatory factor (Ser/Thr protein kinase)
MQDDARTIRELRLAPEPASARRARVAVKAALLASGFEERAGDALLAVTEIVTNAVLHGKEPIVLRIIDADSSIRVEVEDGSPVSPAFSMLDPTAVTGRGLVLVSAVADGWGVDPSERGKTVWFTLERHPVDDDVAEVDRLLASWADTLAQDPAREKVRVVLTDLDTAKLAASESHTEGLLRELALISDSDKTARILRATAPLDALRLDVRHQVALALRDGRPTVDILLTVRREDAEQVRDFMHALDEADRLSRQGELLLLPTPAETSEFRTSFLQRLLNQLRS